MSEDSKAIESYGDIFSAISTEVRTESTHASMARIMVAHGMSKAVKARKAMIGQWIIDFKDTAMENPVVAVDTLRVWLLGGPYKGRVLWPKAVGADDTDGGPLCASSDGIRPRDIYIGETRKDFRRTSELTITEESTCHNCPLSEWLREDGKAIPAPCSESSMYVVWLLDYGVPAYFQSDSSYTRKPFDGGYIKSPRRTWDGIVKMMTGVDKVTGNPYFLRNDIVHGVELSTEDFQRGAVEFPIPRLGWTPLTPEEFNRCKKAAEEYSKNAEKFLDNVSEDTTSNSDAGTEKDEDPVSAPW